MAQYGTAGGGGSCDNDFGMGLIRRWRGAGKPYCDARSVEVGDETSSLTCHLTKQTKHHGFGDQLCVGQNVAISMRDFANEKVTDKVMHDYIATQHMDAAYIHYSPGTLRAAGCHLDASLWRPEAFPGWNLDWQKALEVVPSDSVTDPLQCDVWEETPTLLLQRDTFANFFHDSEDFFNTFIALAVLQWSTRDTQVVLADLYPKGPLGHVGQGLQRRRRRAPPLAWDLKKKYGGGACATAPRSGDPRGREPDHRRVLAHPLPRHAARASVRRLRDPRPGPRPPHALRARHPGVGLLCATTRRRPVRRAVDGGGSAPSAHGDDHVHGEAREQPVAGEALLHACERGEEFLQVRGLGAPGQARKLGRMIRNDAEVVSALKALEQRKFANGAEVHFRDVDFNVLSFEEQIEVDITTDIMVGPHGAVSNSPCTTAFHSTACCFFAKLARLTRSIDNSPHLTGPYAQHLYAGSRDSYRIAH